MWIEYEKAVEVLAERYGLVMLCEEKGLPFAREARDEGRFGVWVVSRASVEARLEDAPKAGRPKAAMV